MFIIRTSGTNPNFFGLSLKVSEMKCLVMGLKIALLIKIHTSLLQFIAQRFDIEYIAKNGRPRPIRAPALAEK